MFSFERLAVWHKSLLLADRVYQYTEGFPARESFGLAQQMRRAVVSISSNLAEGCSRHSAADFARFIEIATGSAFELVSQAEIARRQQMLGLEGHELIYRDTLEIVRMLSGLRRHLRPDPGPSRKGPP